MLNDQFFSEISKINKVGEFIELVSRHYLNFYKKGGLDYVYCHDPLAVLSLIRPQFFTQSKTVSVTVLTLEESVVGVTVCDLRSHAPLDPNANVQVMLDIDADQTLNFLKQQISSFSN